MKLVSIFEMIEMNFNSTSPKEQQLSSKECKEIGQMRQPTRLDLMPLGSGNTARKPGRDYQ